MTWIDFNKNNLGKDIKLFFIFILILEEFPDQIHKNHNNYLNLSYTYRYIYIYTFTFLFFGFYPFLRIFYVSIHMLSFITQKI